MQICYVLVLFSLFQVIKSEEVHSENSNRLSKLCKFSKLCFFNKNYYFSKFEFFTFFVVSRSIFELHKTTLPFWNSQSVIIKIIISRVFRNDEKVIREQNISIVFYASVSRFRYHFETIWAYSKTFLLIITLLICIHMLNDDTLRIPKW